MPTRPTVASLLVLAGLACTAMPAPAQEGRRAYRVMATSKTSTMQKEMSDAAAVGYRFKAAMGGNTAWGGSEVVVVMESGDTSKPRYEYKLLATSKTSTMQKELQDAADAGFSYVGQTVFKAAFGGQEVVCLLEKDLGDAGRPRYEYKLLATTKTSTMQKEMQEVAEQGYEVVGMTVAETLMGGTELVTITRRTLAR